MLTNCGLLVLKIISSACIQVNTYCSIIYNTISEEKYSDRENIFPAASYLKHKNRNEYLYIKSKHKPYDGVFKGK